MGAGAGTLRAAAAAVALLAFGAGCVREVLQPVRETTYVTTRSGDEVTMTWTGRRGTYYNVLYTDQKSAAGQWTLHPKGTNLRAVSDGETMTLIDRVPAGRDRRYRLVQDSKPLVPKR
jgi:hypothetical protein